MPVKTLIDVLKEIERRNARVNGIDEDWPRVVRQHWSEDVPRLISTVHLLRMVIQATARKLTEGEEPESIIAYLEDRLAGASGILSGETAVGDHELPVPNLDAGHEHADAAYWRRYSDPESRKDAGIKESEG